MRQFQNGMVVQGRTPVRLRCIRETPVQIRSIPLLVTSMNFIIQSNLLNEIDFDRLKAALKLVNVPHYFVKVIPFYYDEVEGEPSPGFFKTIPVFAMGS